MLCSRENDAMKEIKKEFGRVTMQLARRLRVCGMETRGSAVTKATAQFYLNLELKGIVNAFTRFIAM